MRIMLITQYYRPEEIGAAVWLHEMSTDFVQKGHEVTVLTGFPNYPSGIIFPEYRGKLFHREVMDGVQIIRTFLYASPQKSFWRRAFNYTSFSLSSVFGGVTAKRPDVILCISAPFLGISALIISKIRRVPFIFNVQDIFPDCIVKTGIVKNRSVIEFLERIERITYRGVQKLTVISEGFKDSLLRKGTPSDRICVIPNWVNTDFITPLPKDNEFRRMIAPNDEFIVLYSGTIGYTSALDGVIASAKLLENYRDIRFVIAGEGVKKDSLEREANDLGLTNVTFLPFQPKEIFPFVLASADICLVTLNKDSSTSSVPSKTLSIMASARPLLGVVDANSEIHRLVKEANCGFCADPEDPATIASAIESCYHNRNTIQEYGLNGRKFALKHFSKDYVINEYERLMFGLIKT